MYFHGEHGPFRWLQSASLGLGELLRDCPQTVVGKFVVVTAFDGGPLELSGDEVAAGWRRIADQAHSPHINNPEVLPHDSYDEWYLFAAPATPQIEEVFINYGGFSLLAPQAPTNWDPSWDRAAEVASQEAVRDQQDRFWLQMARSQAESYLAEGDNLICVTRDVALHTSWLRWAEERAEQKRGADAQKDARGSR